MKDIICPHCHTTFQVDESVYSTIVEQVRNKEFNEELTRQAEIIEKQHKLQEESLKLKIEKDYEARISAKEDELNLLRNDKTRLQSHIDSFESKQKSDLRAFEAEKDKELAEKLSLKDKEISGLKAQLAEKDQKVKLETMEVRDACKSEIHEKERKILELEAQIKADQFATETRELQLKELHQLELKNKQEEIDRLKDFKLRLSTKMLGETLEQHCLIEFNRAKSFGQFPDAVFEKDNTVKEGTKGDFIFKDFIDGQEYVSIMFEMKNEADATAAKHKNEHFFDKLDKDREKKGCEYAVLVSMLEQGNEFYDAGIVDVSYIYPKMLVIRPQFFLPVLRLISEGSRKGYVENRKLLAELEIARNESHDFTKFEERITNFVKTFGRHVKGAHDKFVAATDGIDKIIANLEKQISLLREVKANFELSEQRLLKADSYVEENLTVKKLTHGAPSVRKMIEEASEE